MPKKKRTTDDGSYKTTTKAFDEGAFIDDVLKRTVSFDALDVTAKCIEFGKMLTGIPLYHYQHVMAFRIIHAMLTFEGAVITALLSRQSGKSETMAFVIDTITVLFPALAKVFPDLEQFKDGVKIGLFAPQSDQVFTTYNRAMLRLGSDNAEMIMNDPDIDVGLTSDVRLELTNGSYLKGQVAAKQSKIESKTYDLVILEEAQDLDDYLVEKSIEPMVTATGGTIVKVGTTGTRKNHFWYEIQRNRNMDRKVMDEKLFYHWEFNDRKIIQYRREQYAKDGKMYHLNYEKDVNRKIQRWGADSEAYKLSYALVWSLESGMLITDAEYDKITNKKKGFAEPGVDDHIIMGLDIAKEVNSTVLTIGRRLDNEDDEFGNPKKEIIAWIELGGMDYEVQHHMILDAIVGYGVKVVFADYTGVGKPVVDRLMYACGEYVHIEPFTFSRQSKSEMWYNFISDITTRRLLVPANKTVRNTKEYIHFEDQMKNCTKRFEGSYLVCEKSEGSMDDYVDSCALMCLAGNYDTAEAYVVEQDDMNPLMESMNNFRHKHKMSSY